MSKKKEPNSVEFLSDYIKGISSLNSDEIIKIAEKMHEKEHRDTWDYSMLEDKGDNYIGKQKTFDQYYNERFKEDNK